MKKRFLFMLLPALVLSACGENNPSGEGGDPSGGSYSFFETRDEAYEAFRRFFDNGYSVDVTKIDAELTTGLNADRNDFPHLKNSESWFANYYFNEGNFNRIDVLSDGETHMFTYKHDRNHSILDFGELRGYNGKELSQGRERVLQENCRPEYYTHSKVNGEWTRTKVDGSGERFDIDCVPLELNTPMNLDGCYTLGNDFNSIIFGFDFLYVSLSEFQNSFSGKWDFDFNDARWFDKKTGIFTDQSTYGHIKENYSGFGHNRDAKVYLLADGYVDDSSGYAFYSFTDKISYQLDKDKNFIKISFLAALSRSYDMSDSQFFRLEYDAIDYVEMPAGDTHSIKATEGDMIGDFLYGSNFTMEYTVQTSNNTSGRKVNGVPNKEYRETTRLYSTSKGLLYEIEKYDTTGTGETHSHEFKYHILKDNGTTETYENSYIDGVLSPNTWEKTSREGEDSQDFGQLRLMFFDWYNSVSFDYEYLYTLVSRVNNFDDYNRLVWIGEHECYAKCINNQLVDLFYDTYLRKDDIEVNNNTYFESFEVVINMYDVGTTSIPAFADMNYPHTISDDGLWQL